MPTLLANNWTLIYKIKLPLMFTPKIHKQTYNPPGGCEFWIHNVDLKDKLGASLNLPTHQ